MSNIDINEWSSANQKYLTGTIRLLKEQLELHSRSLNNKQENNVVSDFSLARKELETFAENMSMPPAIERLVKILGLSDFERDILLMCAGPDLDGSFGELVASIQGDNSFLQPTFGLALTAFPEAHWSAVSPGGALRYWRLVELNKNQLVTRSPLKIDEHILHYLAGIRELNDKLKEIAEPLYSKEVLVSSHHKIADLILETISQHSSDHLLPVIQLLGNERSDKMTIAAYISKRLQSQLYLISAHSLPMNINDIAELARLWGREAALNNYVLFLDCSDLDSNDKTKIHSLITFIENIQGVILFHSQQWIPDLKRDNFVYNIEKPTPAEQISLWESILGNQKNVQKAGLDKVVSQFNLSADTIRKAGNEVFGHTNINGIKKENLNGSLSDKIWKVCSKFTRPRIDELAQRIEPIASWDDIVLPETQKSILKEIATQVKQRNKVYIEWGFASKGSRGLGISALFAGESGTGKTMASEVLANELELDLYKIDLSKVVNKYIGETEKNLKRIFDAAEDGGAILLFDEADALFGKRSDVKDSHDRYSNIEVSYLLQRMEAYRGLAILTTNMKNAIDKAFLRRIRFVIQFPFPDAVQRAEIWNRIFPTSTPKSDLDLDKLARLTIPGGSIRNIALNAAFFAADEDRSVQMSHIFRAAKSEYDKIEKPFNNLEIKTWQ